ncbi:nucleotidyltransferase [Neobacillus sp. PS3-40]|uniref:nucleotidyltransferase n=1 Tax=Neobacillus sp. PS3-40 TaxID=3070679 RepID=UPI0027DF9945|nr:nucleotidyltransferase [Neobacillus sp. PS3-40]WML43594.1 nucleotidyltransferase [Neobacillus sp. PS3-40]
MKSVGVIVEYNPFHNGHSYHLEAARALSKADVVIAVMSGDFLQRGEPALVSKWYRTKMALLSGVDIVFELPYLFATQKAEVFANGAISILDAAGCDSLCFGSESGNTHSFHKTIEFLDSHQESYEEELRKYIKTGVSYPKALSMSFEHLTHSEELLNLTTPNNILGFQYMKSIKRQNSSILPLTFKRKNAEYHDESFSSETIASATSIRKALFSDDCSSVSIDQYVPSTTNNLLKEYIHHYGILHQWEIYWPYLQFRILQCDPMELKDIYEVEEGIENRLIAAATESNCFHEFMEKVKTKRYTRTRLQRICTHILTNTKKAEMQQNQEKATYLRLLGMTKKGKEYLNKTKHHFSLPLVSKVSSFKNAEIRLDIKAARIYSYGLTINSKHELLHQEYRQPPIYID